MEETLKPSKTTPPRAIKRFFTISISLTGLQRQRNKLKPGKIWIFSRILNLILNILGTTQKRKPLTK
jgi:hypothetical protein